MGTHQSSPTPGLPLAMQTLLGQQQTQQMPAPAHPTAERQATDDILNEGKLV